MSDTPLVSNQVENKKLDTIEKAKAKSAEAADVLAKHGGGFWHWIDDRQIRVYKPDGTAFATIHVESVQ